MPTLRLSFFGQPRFERDGRPVELASAKSIGLLAYLAVTRAPQLRERLFGLLWAESSEDAARKNLRNTLWAIRKSLGDNILRADDERLSLADSVWVDTWELERIADSTRPVPIAAGSLQSPEQPQLSTTGLYRGPFLDGLAVTEAPEFEIWLTAERERLGQLHLRLLSTLLEGHRAERHWPQVVAVARQALAHDNLQEGMYRALMEAHARLGERAEALRQYDALHATLARELGVEPLPETQAVRAAILSGGIVEALRAASLPASVPALSRTPRRQPVMGDAASPSFVGRRAELDALDAELQAAAGRARIVLLTGELGIGKSRLWQAGRQASRRTLPLWRLDASKLPRPCPLPR